MSVTLTHLDANGHPLMVDITEKKTTQRQAVAIGYVVLTESITTAIRQNTTAKGDVLKIAELAGIMSAKRTPELIPLCHSIRLDGVKVSCVLSEQGKVRIEASVKANETTGVEMEALTAVSVAALTVYDMCKGIDKGMKIEGIELISKSGGKSGDYTASEASSPHLRIPSRIKAAVLTVSDKGYKGEREDTAGPALCSLLSEWGAEVVDKALVPDEKPQIIRALQKWLETGKIQLILTTGGTGLSSRDVTPDALLGITERIVPGIGELMRSASLHHTPNAALSRGIAVTSGSSLIVAMPGSRRGAIQCFEAIRSCLEHAVEILNNWSNEGTCQPS